MLRLLNGIACTGLALVLMGCSESAPPAVPPAPAEPTAKTPAEHAHPDEGPHGGSLVELGDEKYHAELLHDDDKGTVTIYLLDGAAKNAVLTDAKEITFNVKHAKEAEQFQLAA